MSSLEDLLASDMKLVVSANSSIQEYFSEASPFSTPGKLKGYSFAISVDGFPLLLIVIFDRENFARSLYLIFVCHI